jgi:hypothetical protein
MSLSRHVAGVSLTQGGEQGRAAAKEAWNEEVARGAGGHGAGDEAEEGVLAEDEGDEHSEEKKRKWSTRRKMRILQELSRSAR